MRSALIVDVHNLYLGIQRKFPGRSVDYAQLVRHHQCADNDFFFKIAYGRQPEEKVEAFAKVLRNLGFEIRFGANPYAIDLAVTVAEMIERRAIRHLILGSVALETIPLLEYLRNHGVYTTIAGFDVPSVFGKFATNISELDEEFIMLPATNQNNVPANSTGVSVAVAC